MKKNILIIVTLIVMSLLLSSCGGSSSSGGGGGDTSGGGGAAAAPEQNVTLKVGTILSTDDLSTQALEEFSKLVDEKSGGTIKIELYPASQLGNATSQIEAVGLGSQDMFHGSGSWLATYVPDRGIAAMFFMFQDEEHFVNYINSDLMKDVEEQFRNNIGAKVISNNWLIIPRSMASKKEINTVDDMQGLKMRVPDIKAYLDSVTALGAAPTQIAYGETYLALKQGVVDACEGPFDNLYTMKFYEAANNIIMTEHLRDNYVLMINEKKFDSLSENQQKALVDAGNEAGLWFNDKAKSMIEEYTNILKDEGANFMYPDTAEFAEREKAKVLELEAAGEWAAGLYEKVQALAQ